MRYGIFSDVHSNLEALQVVLEAYKKESIDIYLCAGDIVGYGANPNECIELIRSLGTTVVAGNHDWGSVDLFPLEYFNPAAYQALLWTKDNLTDAAKTFLRSLQLVYKKEALTLVHGTLQSPQNFHYLIDGYVAGEIFRLLETRLCFVGHTHVSGIFIKDKKGGLYYSTAGVIDIEVESKYIVNTGSVGQSRDSNPQAAYCIYDSEKKQVQIKRVDYDMATSRKKIIMAGLPVSLGNRLMVGR